MMFQHLFIAKSQNLVRIHMNNARFNTEHENKISVLALLCWCQFGEETNLPEITQK